MTDDTTPKNAALSICDEDECDNGFIKEYMAGGAYYYRQCPKKDACLLLASRAPKE